jgi:protocatechuate 3,4-dioxygenase beta subunit
MKAPPFSGLTPEVVGRIAADTSPRLRFIMTTLIEHLHGFARDVELTQEEWSAGVEFLTRAGQMCSESRQEFILLSDILGLSMLVDAIDNPAGDGITDSTVLGPFYSGRQRELESGASILLRAEDATPLVMVGQVWDQNGEPIESALVEVWQTSPNELYDVQDAEQPHGHLRGSFRTSLTGQYRFETIMPVSYPIPDDGPAGQLLKAMGRHPYRPAHIHFMISARGFRKLVTHLFIAGDEYLASDAVFGVKQSLVVEPCMRDGIMTIVRDFGLAPS